VWCENHSDLFALESSLELNSTEPVVVGLLGLVISVRKEEGSGTEVKLERGVEYCVDKNQLGVGHADHLFLSLLIISI
jgi:hypothetical protein